MAPSIAGTGQKLRALARLGPRGWTDLVRAGWALVRWSMELRLRPRGRLVGPSGAAREVGPQDPGPGPGASRVPERARALALAVDRAARHGPIRPACLARSLALKDLLDREGLEGARVRFGVRKREGRFEAHAWIEVQGHPVGCDARLAHVFEPVARLESFGAGG